MKGFLQGDWLGHPVHPLLVHLPTGLWPAALVFDILTRFDIGGNGLVRASFFAIVLGLVSALAAAPTGLADWSGIKRDRPAWSLGLIHMALNLVATALFALNAYLRLDDWDKATKVDPTHLFLSVVGTAALLIGGYLGGRLVFEYGISVARQSKDEWRERAIAGRARVPEEG